MTAVEIAVIGDRFMTPEIFARKIESATDCARIRSLRLDWPDTPMRFDGGEWGISEFVGDPDEIADFVGDAEIFVTHLAPLTAAMLARLPKLKLVAVARGGPVNIDSAAAAARGIEVVCTPGRNASAVAEFTVGLILSETRRIRAGHESMRRGEWRGDLYRADSTGDELSDLVVGSVGYGRVGSALARLLRPFGCRLLAFDPYAKIEDDDVAEASLDALLAESDVVVLNARVTAESAGIIGREQLAKMKPSALLVNAARGPLVDYDALRDALSRGVIAAAALDTFAVEPPPAKWPLLRLPNVTLTPHIAGASRRTVVVAASRIAEEIRNFLTKAPHTGVDLSPNRSNQS